MSKKKREVSETFQSIVSHNDIIRVSETEHCVYIIAEVMLTANELRGLLDKYPNMSVSGSSIREKTVYITINK